MSQRSTIGSTNAAPCVPNGAASAAATVTGTTSRQLQRGSSRIVNGRCRRDRSAAGSARRCAARTPRRSAECRSAPSRSRKSRARSRTAPRRQAPRQSGGRRARPKGRHVGKIDHGTSRLENLAHAYARSLRGSACGGCYQRGTMGQAFASSASIPGLRRTGWGLIGCEGNRLILPRLRLGRDQREALARRAAGRRSMTGSRASSTSSARTRPPSRRPSSTATRPRR